MSSVIPDIPGRDVDYDTALADLAALGAKLSDFELRWRDRQRFLEGKGYMLRARYHPEWVPSWTHNGKKPTRCEDFCSLPFRPNLIDATRISDGRLVYIKRVHTSTNEIDIASVFSDEGLKNNPTNHGVPVLDTFRDDDDVSISYLVMPFLRLMDSPGFTHVNDVVEFVDQVMEGLVFMHALGIAHRDLARKNIMVDAASMYPKGYHPVRLDSLPDISIRAPFISRIAVWPPVKYYFVDFGIAVRIPPEVHPKLALGDLGIDREVPELSVTTPYDPFKVDIFILGNVFRRDICAKFSNVDFLQPLINSMTVHDPRQRPDADDALKSWRKVRGGVCFVSRGFRLKQRDMEEGWPIVFDVTAFLKLGVLLSRRILMWTARWLALLNCFRRP